MVTVNDWESVYIPSGAEPKFKMAGAIERSDVVVAPAVPLAPMTATDVAASNPLTAVMSSRFVQLPLAI